MDALSRAQDLGTAGVGRYQLGDDQAQRSFDAFCDDVLVDTPT